MYTDNFHLSVKQIRIFKSCRFTHFYKQDDNDHADSGLCNAEKSFIFEDVSCWNHCFAAAASLDLNKNEVWNMATIIIQKKSKSQAW